MADLIQQFLEVKAFDGGMTDNYLDCPLNSYEKADNFLVEQDKTLLVRPGSVQYDATSYRVLSQRVNELINYSEDTVLLARCLSNILYPSSGWQLLLGPSGNAAFPGSDATNNISWSHWKKHLYLTTDKLTSPMKVYKSGSTLYLRNAGLPSLALATTPTIRQVSSGTKETISDVYDAVAEMATKVKAHIADLSQHKAAQQFGTDFDEEGWTIEKVENVLQRLANIWGTSWPPSGLTNGHGVDANLNSGWAYHYAKESVASSLATQGNHPDTGTLWGELTISQASFNTHDADNGAHDQAGLHQLTELLSTDAVNDWPNYAITSLKSYIWAFVPVYEYTIDGVTYSKAGAPKLSPRFDFLEPSNTLGATIEISNIPVIAASENYDTGNIKINIYRTEGDGTRFYYVGQVTNGVTTFTDTFIDAEINSNEVLYTDGDVLDNDPPPKAKYVHIENGVALWGNIKDSSAEYPYRVRQSVPEDPDSCPASLNSDFDQPVRGVSGARGKHIILCEKKVYRRDGYYNELGDGIVTHDCISETAGIASNSSCVQTQDGLFWAGNDGFYFTDGYQVTKISEGLETTYAAITSTAAKKAKIKGVYDQKHNVILWTAQLSANECDTIFVLNLKHGIRKTSCFTTWSGGVDFSPTAITVFNNQIVRVGGKTDGTLPGYVFKHDDSYDTDLQLDASEADPANWIEKAVIWDYCGPATSFGNSDLRKWVTKILLTARNKGDVSVQVYGINDNNKTNKKKALNPMRFRGETGVLKRWIRFPAGGLRCDYKQIQITNAYTYITNSDTLGLATIDNAAKTATLLSGSFPDESIGYYLRIAGVDYLITDQSPVAIELSDSEDSLPNGDYAWEMVGYPSGEVFHLQEYIVRFAFMGQNQQTFDGTTGGNA